MKRILSKIAIASLLLVFASSCAITVPVTVSRAPIGNKKGVSESIVILGVLYLNGKYGVKDAANKGKISSAIATIDEKTTNYLLFAKKELIVTAE